MNQKEEFEAHPAKKRWPLWVGALAFLGVAAVLARVFCKGGGCGSEDSCCKPSKAA